MVSPTPKRRQEPRPVVRGWRRSLTVLCRHRLAAAGAVIIMLLYASALFADPVAPYGPAFDDKEKFYHPPVYIRVMHEGRLQRPFVYNYVLADPGTRAYAEDRARPYPIRVLVRGDAYRYLGLIPSNLHLLGVDQPARLFLLGTDQFGRDAFTLLLFGGRISLTIGLVGEAITTVLGMLVGGIAGYYGGMLDNILMRVVELLQGFPSFYLFLFLSAIIPAGVSSGMRMMMIIAILSLIGWAGFARIIRGMVLSLREVEFVQAARALGLGDLRIIWRHVLPNTYSYIIVVISLTLPGYILGESGLSFFGLGVQDSWGNMLAKAQDLTVLTQYPWLLAPGVFILLTVLAFNTLGDGLRDALDPRAQSS